MVCSCIVLSLRVLLQIIFCSCVTGTTLSRGKWQIASLSCQEVVKIWKQTWWSNDKTITELGYITKYRNLSVSRMSVPHKSVSSCVSVITWLCSRVMWFQSRPINLPVLTIESPVAQWLEHPTRSRRVVGSNPIWGSDFFRVLQTFNLSFLEFTL